MIVGSTSKELFKQARDLIFDPQNDEKSLRTCIVALEDYQNSKTNSISLRTDAEQELYTKYVMALNVFDFEINDFIKAIYILIRLNLSISDTILKKLNVKLRIKFYFINSDSWFMLFNIFTFYKENFEFITFSQTLVKLKKLKPSSSDICIQCLLDLCYFSIYNEGIWKNLLSYQIVIESKHLDKLRIINYAVETEGKNKFSKVLAIGVKLLLEDCLKIVSKEQSSIAPMKLGILAINKMHREIDFVLKNLMKFEENVNIDNVFLVDFYNKDENLGLDISSAIHYLTQDISQKQESLDENSLIPIIKLKSSLLKKNGYNIGRIPFYEWNRFIDHTEKLLYLRRKIRLLKFK